MSGPGRLWLERQKFTLEEAARLLVWHLNGTDWSATPDPKDLAAAVSLLREREVVQTQTVQGGEHTRRGLFHQEPLRQRPCKESVTRHDLQKHWPELLQTGKPQQQRNKSESWEDGTYISPREAPAFARIIVGLSGTDLMEKAVNCLREGRKNEWHRNIQNSLMKKRIGYDDNTVRKVLNFLAKHSQPD